MLYEYVSTTVVPHLQPLTAFFDSPPVGRADHFSFFYVEWANLGVNAVCRRLPDGRHPIPT